MNYVNHEKNRARRDRMYYDFHVMFHRDVHCVSEHLFDHDRRVRVRVT